MLFPSVLRNSLTMRHQRMLTTKKQIGSMGVTIPRIMMSVVVAEDAVGVVVEVEMGVVVELEVVGVGEVKPAATSKNPRGPRGATFHIQDPRTFSKLSAIRPSHLAV